MLEKAETLCALYLNLKTDINVIDVISSNDFDSKSKLLSQKLIYSMPRLLL